MKEFTISLTSIHSYSRKPWFSFPPSLNSNLLVYRLPSHSTLQTLIDLIDLTPAIHEMNRNAVNPITGLPLGEYTTPTFHIWGRKGGATDYIIGPRNLMESTQEVHDTEWREAEYDKMLHLNNGARLRMGMFCIKYFQVIYGVIVCYAPSEKAGLELERRIAGKPINKNVEKKTVVFESRSRWKYSKIVNYFSWKQL